MGAALSVVDAGVGTELLPEAAPLRTLERADVRAMHARFLRQRGSPALDLGRFGAFVGDAAKGDRVARLFAVFVKRDQPVVDAHEVLAVAVAHGASPPAAKIDDLFSLGAAIAGRPRRSRRPTLR